MLCMDHVCQYPKWPAPCTGRSCTSSIAASNDQLPVCCCPVLSYQHCLHAVLYHANVFLAHPVAVCMCVQTIALASFVMLHHVQRTDTLQMLAVRYGVDVTTIKRVNNLMSDHSLHSRQHLYIPGGSATDSSCACHCAIFCSCPLMTLCFSV